ncbi:MAG: thiamine pyrophosphate-binding protein [Methanomicrobiales archaeon]|nr:thiamine pyrophosphate-binding protein [Methanomicrobiales archaeon]
MAIWRCSVCGYQYDEEKGEPASETPAGTRFEALPETWRCPVCGAPKAAFVRETGDEVHEQAETTVSDIIVEELERWGVELVFGLPGTSSLGLVDAVRKSGRIRYIVVRHEANASMAASAYNKLTGKIAACLTIAGPGATNLATGLYDALQDGASVLSLNGQVRMQYTGPYGIQEIDQDAFFRAITVYNNTIYDREMTVLLLNRALKYATLRRGPAQLSVPNNIQKQRLDRRFCRCESILKGSPVLPDPKDLKRAVEAVDESERPVIIAGWGAMGNGEAILALARKIRAPILTTFRAKGIISEENEWVLGVLGTVGSPQARTLAERSDLLITLGVGFSRYTNIPTDRKIVQLDVNPLKLGQGSESIILWGDCHLVLPVLVEKSRTKPDGGEVEAIAELKREWQAQLEAEADPDAKPLRPPYIMKVLSEKIPMDAVITLDVGENQWWFGRNFRMRGQRFTMSGYLATMGFGLPAALAAKLAYPGKQVFCITGDGGFSQAMSDFVTAVKYNLPILVVLLNNHQLGMIQVEQMMEHYPNFGTDLLNPDFATYGEICGGVGIKVRAPADLGPAISQAMDLARPVILDIETDPRRFI